MYEQQNKQIQIVLLCSLIVSVIVISCIWIYRKLFQKFDMLDNQANQLLEMQNDSNARETFNNKRETRMKIYKSDEIYDPDETPEIEDNDDPDSDPMQFDPDQQPYLDDQENPKQYRSKRFNY